MPAYKFTYEFESTVGNTNTSGSRAGWSESWYRLGIAGLPQAIAIGQSYSHARRRLLTPGWSITAMRVSELNGNLIPKRRGTLVFLPASEQPGMYPTPRGVDDEQPYDAIEIAIGTANGIRRNFQMRGIASNVINAGGRFMNPANWQPAFNQWLGNLNGSLPGGAPGDGFDIRFRNNPVTYTIVAVAINPAGGFVGASPISPVVDILTNVIPGVDNSIQIQRTTGIARLNGTWNVKSAAVSPDPLVTRVVLKPKRRVVCTGTLVLPGTATIWNWDGDGITIATPGYGVSRRTGRPLQLTRGRRSNRD